MECTYEDYYMHHIGKVKVNLLLENNTYKIDITFNPNGSTHDLAIAKSQLIIIINLGLSLNQGKKLSIQTH